MCGGARVGFDQVDDQARAAAAIPAGDKMIVCQICCEGVADTIGL